MRRFALMSCVCLALAAPKFASGQEEPDSKPAQETTQSLADQLKEKPDDNSLFNKYMIKNLGEVRAAINTDVDKAEQQLAKMKELMDSLEPTTDAGKQITARAKQVIQAYGQQVALGRVTLDELVAKLKENPDDLQTISMYQSKLMMEVGPLTRTEPEKAEKRIAAAKELLAAAKESAKKDEAKTLIGRIESSFGRLEQQIEAGKKLAALVGSDAAPLEVEDWVNGEPLTDEQLKGKVVLLDFWAVWCGPCVATFPHLREWHEKYADKGLEIIGLTSYYKYTWDEEAGRAKRAPSDEEVTPEQEREMLVKFAEHHNLHHRFAIQKGSALSDYYVVTGIPHVVLIDREGKVRLYKIGSGEENAKAIAEMIDSLITEG